MLQILKVIFKGFEVSIYYCIRCDHETSSQKNVRIYRHTKIKKALDHLQFKIRL